MRRATPEMRYLLSLLLLAAACKDPLGPEDYADIADDAAKIARCQALGRACKADGGTDCFGAYDACMTDAGLR